MEMPLGLLPFVRLMAAVLCALIWFAPAYAQDSTALVSEAQITFYSNRVTVLGGTLGHKPGAFLGRIFDGDRQLAFMQPASFVTFRVASGIHVFSATSWMIKHLKPGTHLRMNLGVQITMNLAVNQHYFVESGTLTGDPLFVLREVTCTDAQRDNTRSEPLKPVHLRPDGIPIAVHEITFPRCP